MLEKPFQVQRLTVSKEKRIDEYLGSKTKFWFERVTETSERTSKWLWKQARSNTIEDVTEKLAAHLANLLGIPAALVELAECDGSRGSITESFLREGDGLVHGNEVLALLDNSYVGEARYHAHQHTVEAALDALDRLSVASWPDWDAGLPSISCASDLFLGYLLFDAWIGNTDRHHENWAIVQRGSARYLTPSFDHASSLGPIEPLAKINLRLTGKDPRCTVKTYVDRTRSAFYASGVRRPIHPVYAFLNAEKLRPIAAAYWRAKLDAICPSYVDSLSSRMPIDLWSQSHVAFCKRLLETNLSRIRSAHV